jgi:hypothetical protein
MTTPDDAGQNDFEVDADRRNLMLATGAGLLGAAVLTPAAAQAQRAAPAAVVEDPKAPPGMGKTGIPDGRFPLSYQTPVSEGTRVLMDHLAALGRRDSKAVAETLHFPFGSYEGTNFVVVDTPEAFLAKPPASLNMTLNPKRHSDNDGFLKPGTYDVFQGLEVMGCHPVNATIALTYDRYGGDGKKLLRCEGIYAVTNNDGKWAIQLASTIFTPADMIGVVFDETLRQAKLARVNHTLSADTGDDEFDKLSNQYGRSGGVSGGASWTAQMQGHEKIMAAYKVKGVKNRLTVSTRTPETSLRGDRGTYQEYWDTMGKIGLGPWGFIYGTWKEGRVVHHTANKAHVQASAVRYTAAGEEMSLAVQTMVVTYKKGRWGMDGNLIYATPHDRANDLHPGGLSPV